MRDIISLAVAYALMQGMMTQTIVSASQLAQGGGIVGFYAGQVARVLPAGF